MRLKAFAAVYVLYKSFWVFTWRRYLVRDQRFEIACVSHYQPVVHIETLIMGHRNSLETLVPDQITTPGKNPKTSMEYHLLVCLSSGDGFHFL